MQNRFDAEVDGVQYTGVFDVRWSAEEKPAQFDMFLSPKPSHFPPTQAGLDAKAKHVPVDDVQLAVAIDKIVEVLQAKDAASSTPVLNASVACGLKPLAHYFPGKSVVGRGFTFNPIEVEDKATGDKKQVLINDAASAKEVFLKVLKETEKAFPLSEKKATVAAGR